MCVNIRATTLAFVVYLYSCGSLAVAFVYFASNTVMHAHACIINAVQNYLGMPLAVHVYALHQKSRQKSRNTDWRKWISRLASAAVAEQKEMVYIGRRNRSICMAHGYLFCSWCDEPIRVPVLVLKCRYMMCFGCGAQQKLAVVLHPGVYSSSLVEGPRSTMMDTERQMVPRIPGV